MARKPRPWFRKQNKTWYVKINGNQVRLAANKKEAEQRFHELMAARGSEKPVESQELLACEVADKFLSWCSNHRATRTMEGYKEHLERFFKWLPFGKTMLAKDLKPFHVIEYMDAHDWGNCYSRNAAAAVQRAFKWAVSVGLLDFHPCTTIPKPKGERRENPMTEEEYRLIVKHSRPDFSELVSFAWESGARPHEIRIMRPEYVQGDRVVYPVQESKGKRRSRVIYLNDTAREIIERRVKLGHEWVFVNARGKQWSASNINNRMDRLKGKVGRKVCLYRSRHAFTQRGLEAGIGVTELAEIMGHANSAMIGSVYSHMNEAGAHIKKQLEKLNRNTEKV